MPQARRARVQISYNGKDITKDLAPYLPALYTALDEVAAMNCIIEK